MAAKGLLRERYGYNYASHSSVDIMSTILNSYHA